MQILKQRGLSADTKLLDRWLVGQFVVMTLKVVITVILHKPAKVMLAACSGTDDTVAMRPVHTSCGFALKHD